MTILDDPITPTSLGGIRVQKVRDVPFNFNMLIYGEYGVGKTLLAGMADDVPEMRRVLFLDIEGGTQSLRDFPNVDVLRVTDWNSMQRVYDEFRVMQHEYRTVVIDSLTELQDFNMSTIMETMLRKPDHEERDPDVPGLHEWNKNSKQIRKFVRAWRDLPVSTIFTALSKQELDKMKRPKTMVGLPGKLAREIPGFFDYVFYYYVDNIEDQGEVRLLRTRKTSDIAAKARQGMKGDLPEIIGNPTMRQLYTLIRKFEQETMNV